MTNYLDFGEGFLAACGVLMAVVAALLWRHHPIRPAWGLRWLAGAMGCGALINLLAPLLVTQVGRMGVLSPFANAAQLVAMVVGFGSLAALVVGTRHYMLRPPRNTWRFFLFVWLGAQLGVILGVGVFRLGFLADYLTAGIFVYCAWLAFAAVRQEPSVGHGVVGLALLSQPLTLLLLAVLGWDITTARYLAAAPYTTVGLVFLSATLIRLHNELATELRARSQAETRLQSNALALQQSHAVQMALLQHAPVPTSHSPVVEGKLMQTYWNHAWYTTFGYAPGTKEGVPGSSFDFYADSKARDQFIQEVLTHGHVGPFDVQLKTAGGAIRLCQTYASLIDSDEGQFVVSSYFDVTEQRQNEMRLREFEAMVQSADDVILLYSNNQITFANAAAGRMFGLPVHELVGRGVADLSPLTQADGSASQPAAQAVVRLALGGQPQRFPWQHLRANGEIFTAQVSLTAMDKAPGQLVGVLRDISEQELAAFELRKARQMAETIARAQLEFIVQKDRHRSFDGLLNDILALADSEYGFIGEVLQNAEGHPYLKTFAITNIAWNDATRAFYAANAPKGMEFSNLKSLFGHVLTTREPVIANDPYHDPRRGGLPEGHPALNAFLGVPVFHGNEMVAMFGISNRPGGYDESVVEYLRPLTATIGQLVVAHRSQVRQEETELRLDSISNNLPNSMVYQVDCGEDGTTRRFTYLSAGIEHLHGLSRTEVLRDANLLYTQIHPEDLPKLAQLEAACVQSMSEFNIEYRGRGPNGEERWFYLASTPSRNADHHIVWDGIELDITERKRAESELALSQVQLKANLDHTPTVAVQWFDREGRVLYWNPASEALYGVTASEVMGQVPLGTLYANEAELQGLLDVIAEIETTGKAYGPYEVDITCRNGTVVSVLATTFPIPMGAGRTAFVCMDVDITARKKAEQDLQELNQSLESRVQARTRELTQALSELNRAQQDLIQSEKLAALGSLVAGVAHELNTPIGNAVTVSSTLVDAHADIRARMTNGLTRGALNDFLDTVGEAGAMLSRNLVRAADLVSSFKQVAVDQSSHLRRTFLLQDILSEVDVIMTPSLRKAHVRLHLDLRDKPSMDSFPGALTQVLMILITNAIAHAFEGRDGGTVTITAAAEGSERVLITVADDGVGIAAANLGRIFEPFFTTKLGKGGSGLGLHICYNVVTGTLGGKVVAYSTPAQGTRMVIDIPLSAPHVPIATSTPF